LQASNDKLRARARRAVAIATAAPEDQVAEAISAADGDTKVAISAAPQAWTRRPHGRDLPRQAA
jgi:N-acetylmuramic acid 6-phosphate (MurNAc-6-P) etherase